MTKTLFKILKIRGLLPLFLFLGLLLNSSQTYAQKGPDYETTTDSVFLITHNPHKATFLSILVPGLGQIYNEKYWKVPIIYAGFTGLIYYANYNNFVYNKYKNAYNVKLKIDAGATGLSDEYEGYSTENLRNLKDDWRRYRDLVYISAGLLYVMQILDANVDAHLFDYDISEDLSMRIEPAVIQNPNLVMNSNYNNSAIGFRCAIRF